MAALMFSLPEETARILKELDVPEGNPEHHAHITVAHLGDDVPIDRIGALIPVLYDVTSETVPFSVSTSRLSTFPAGDDGVPVIAMVDSPELHAFRDKLCAAMDEAGIEYSKKFPVFKPHVTITYARDRDTKLDMSFPPVSFPCHELLLWGSNRGTGRLVVKFPLSLPMARVAQQQWLPRHTGRAVEAYAEARRTHLAYRRAMVQLAMWREEGHDGV